MSTNRIYIKGLDPAALEACLAALGESAPFRARQVFQWIHGRGANTFDEMTDLSKATRVKFEAALAIGQVEVAEVATSTDGTMKLAIRLEDGALVESVIIPERDRYTLCVSTQVGCALACRFCFTGVMGWGRQMAAHEIVDQLYQANRLLAMEAPAHRTPAHRAPARRITHVVFMGMGEPLANYDATLAALRLMTNPLGAGLSAFPVGGHADHPQEQPSAPAGRTVAQARHEKGRRVRSAPRAPRPTRSGWASWT